MVGTLTYEEFQISTGLQFMSEKYLFYTVCNFLSSLTPSPFPTFAQWHEVREGEQDLKPLSEPGRVLERGFKNKSHIALCSQWLNLFCQVTLGGCSAFLVLAAPTITNFPVSKVLAETAISQNLEAASFFQQGVTRYNRKDLQGAEYAFRQALQHDPNLGAARNYLGNIFMEQNRLDVALQEYAEAIRVNPDFSEAYYNLGLVLHRQGEKEAAIIAYRQSLVIDSTRVAALYNLGLLLYEQGQLQDAIAAYQKAISLDSSNANAYFNLAIALQQQGQIEPAIASYRQALQLNPKNAAAYYNLGVTLYPTFRTSISSINKLR